MHGCRLCTVSVTRSALLLCLVRADITAAHICSFIRRQLQLYSLLLFPRLEHAYSIAERMDLWRRVRDAVGDRGGKGPRYQLVGGVDEALTNFKNRSSRAKTIILSAGTIVFLMLLYIAVSFQSFVVTLWSLETRPHFHFLLSCIGMPMATAVNIKLFQSSEGL